MRILKARACLPGWDDVPEELYEEARNALDRGDAEGARDRIARAYEANPTDPAVRELYAGLLLAQAIRLAAQAREARRADILRRNIGYDEEFHDSPDVAKLFDEALAAHDEVLRVDASHEKARMMKAALLFRRDRAAGRVQALEILRAILAAHPGNRQVAYAIRKIETPCRRCSDTGFCPDCIGTGQRRRLGFTSKCRSCHGQGICLACGVV